MDKVEDIKSSKKKLNFDVHNHKFDRKLDTQISESDLALWEQSPPVAEISVSNTKTKRDKRAVYIKRCSRFISLLAVIASLVCVWLMLAIPHLCYFKVGLCGAQTSTQQDVSQLSVMNCSGHVYVGRQCQGRFGTCSNPTVNKSIDDTLESDLSTLFSILDAQTLSSTCEPEKQLIEEFVCSYSYKPCDGNDQIILPARNVCTYIRDDACASEWSLLRSSQYGSLLPNCDILPVNHTPSNTCSDSSAAVQPVNVSTDDIPTPSPTTTSNNNNNNNNNVTNGTCSGIKYTEQVCSQYLNPCTVNSYSSSLNKQLKTLFDVIPLASDASCKANEVVVQEFLCQISFPRCDDDLLTHMPNMSHCEYIRDTLCPNDWVTLDTVIAPGVLPNCSNLPVVSSNPTCSDINKISTTTTPEPVRSLELNCNEAEGFYLYFEDDENSTLNNTCQARCSEWSQYDSETITVLNDAIVIIFTVIGLIGCIAVFIFSGIRRERMLIFPSIFIVYGTVDLILIVILILIQYSDRKALSCSENDLVATTIQDSPIFCSISGFILVHSLISLTYWWIAHISTIFWKIMFPFHAKSYEDRTKCIHILIIILWFVLSFVPPSLVFAFDGYFTNRFPPLLCLPRNSDITYAILLLPLSVVCTVGISLLIFVLHAIHEKSRLFHYRVSKTHKFGLSAAEKKLLVVFFYYLALIYIDVIGFTVATSLIDVVREHIQENFACEAFRVDPDYDCPRQFVNVSVNNTLVLLTYVFLGLYPVVNLVFAINKSEVKVKVVSWFPSFFSESYRTSTLSTSVGHTSDTPFTLRRRLTYNVSAPDMDHIKKSYETSTFGRSGKYVTKE